MAHKKAHNEFDRLLQSAAEKQRRLSVTGMFAPPTEKEPKIRKAFSIFAAFIGVFGIGMEMEGNHPYIGIGLMGAALLYLIWELSTSRVVTRRIGKSWRVAIGVCAALVMLLVSWPHIKTIFQHQEKPPNAAVKQEPLTLKGLFNSDFGGRTSSNNEDETLTIGSKSGRFPTVVLKFTSKLHLDMAEGTKFFSFYVPHQDGGFEESSRRTVLLCSNLPDKFPEILERLSGLVAIEPRPNGSTLKSTELPLSRRVYIYYEDPISPQNLGDLVHEYEAKQLLVEFRSNEYVGRQEMLRALGLQRPN